MIGTHAAPYFGPGGYGALSASAYSRFSSITFH
jgi:hypothetical protein